MTRHVITLTIPQRYVFLPHSGKAREPFKRDPRLRQPVCQPTTPEPKQWCVQCDRLVHPNEARSCNSQWCKAKLALLEQEAKR